MRKRKKNFSELSDIQLSDNSLASLFTVKNDGDIYRFLASRTLYVTGTDAMIPSLYNEYEVKEGDQWTLISYQFYGTVDLWWLICKFNDVKNPFEKPAAGTKLKMPTSEFAQAIVQQLGATA